jgi:hypothetical protein
MICTLMINYKVRKLPWNAKIGFGHAHCDVCSHSRTKFLCVYVLPSIRETSNWKKVHWRYIKALGLTDKHVTPPDYSVTKWKGKFRLHLIMLKINDEIKHHPKHTYRAWRYKSMSVYLGGNWNWATRRSFYYLGETLQWRLWAPESTWTLQRIDIQNPGHPARCLITIPELIIKMY